MAKGNKQTAKNLVAEPVDLIDPKNQQEALILINADRMPGQPECTPEMLRQAIKGSSPIDNQFWEDLVQLEHIAVKRDERLVGVTALGKRHDNTGVLLWMHTVDDADVVEALIDLTETKLSDCPKTEAFGHASALSLGVEALPYRQQLIHKALINHGYMGADSWLYMRADLPEPAAIVVEIEPVEEEPNKTFQLALLKDNIEVSSATIAVTEGIGVIWWIETKSEYKGHGWGRKMLKQAQAVLSHHDAKEVILFVDHDSPDDPDRNRDAAISLYLSEGFKIEDHLWSYTKKNAA